MLLLSFKDTMIGYMLDHDYHVFKLGIHGLLVNIKVKSDLAFTYVIPADFSSFGIFWFMELL